MATLGAAYDEGAPLFRIVRTDRVELEVQVPSADVLAARSAAGLVLELPGVATPITVQPRHVHDAGVIDPITRALPLQMEIDNPGERLLIGRPARPCCSCATESVPVVPNAAVLMEAGRPPCSSSLVANDSPAGSSSSHRAMAISSA